jgi:glycosyltransferase involved in cell wall biosynthesis
MKVLFCTNSFELITNGPAKFANLLWKISEEYPDIEVRILTEDVSEEKERVYKMKVQYSPIFRYLGQVIRIFLYRKNIRQIKSTYSYDILIFNHSFHGLAVSYGENKPIIGMINDDNACSRNLSNFEFTKDWISYYLYGKLERWSIRRFKSILVNSVFLKHTLIRDYALPSQLANKLQLFYKAVELELYPAPFRPIGKPVRVLFVKVDFERGGLGVLARALASLPHIEFELTIIGPEERFFNVVREMVGSNSHVKVSLLGYRNAAEVRKAMYEHDIFCVPSLLEALGVANLEALSRGISVVSSDAGGIPEVLDQGRAGWMVPVGDDSALARAIEECIVNEPLRKEKRENGLKYARDFDVKIMYERFKQMIKNHVGG